MCHFVGIDLRLPIAGAQLCADGSQFRKIENPLQRGRFFVAAQPQRGFRTPWVPLVPVLGVLFCLWLMLGLPTTAWIRFGVWLVIGITFYALYGWRRSRLRGA